MYGTTYFGTNIYLYETGGCANFSGKIWACTMQNGKKMYGFMSKRAKAIEDV